MPKNGGKVPGASGTENEETEYSEWDRRASGPEGPAAQAAREKAAAMQGPKHGSSRQGKNARDKANMTLGSNMQAQETSGTVAAERGQQLGARRGRLHRKKLFEQRGC